MKKTHIIGIIIIALAIGIIMTTAGDASTYVSFSEAIELAEDGNAKKVHVVGRLKKDKAGHIVGMQYDPLKDPNYFFPIQINWNSAWFTLTRNRRILSVPSKW